MSNLPGLNPEKPPVPESSNSQNSLDVFSVNSVWTQALRSTPTAPAAITARSTSRTEENHEVRDISSLIKSDLIAMLAENSLGFKPEWIAEANTSSTGGLALEHDIQIVTIDAAIRNLPGLQKAYKVVTVGQCAGVASYKEGNFTIPIRTTVASYILPSAATSAPVVTATPSREAQVATGQSAANVLGASASFFVTLFLRHFFPKIIYMLFLFKV
ncbi:hypothetical protein HPULCUR_001366 [Helicostylum pulchrum]|uniref:Uncharacterized protein n=1 Tax=Helicostylum pulchrum TaxID=562976 RepID=A0ABP9XNS1_9FUNG